MYWLSGFVGFRVRTLIVSVLVVYLLLRQARLSSEEKKGIWFSGLVFLGLRVVLEIAARAQGLWEYTVTDFSLVGVPIDVLVAVAVFFGSGAALIQHYLQGNKIQRVLSQLGLALLVTWYDFWGARLYGYFRFGSGGYLNKLLVFWFLTLASGAFYSWFRRRRNKEV
ncbi:MAG: hypothetical protein H0Z38_00130 [Firmicutes bacterium]|nr:hypothetical protein [Bacillota bacterium]